MAKKRQTNYYEVREIRDLRDMFYQSVTLYVDKPAFMIKREARGPYEDITFGQVRMDVETLGTALVRLFADDPVLLNDEGCRAPRIGIVAKTRYEWYISYLAAVIGEAVVVPLDRMLGAGELHNMMSRVDLDAVFFDSADEAKVLEAVKDVDSMRWLISMDEPETEELSEDPRHLPFETLMKQGEEALAAGDRSFFEVEIDPDEMRVILFNSGTTSTPKGVMHSHKTICACIMDLCHMIYIGPKDTFLSVLPLNHSYECVCGFLTPFYRGSTIAVSEGIRYIADNMKEAKMTVMLLVPLIAETVHSSILRKIKKDPEVYKKVQRVRGISDWLYNKLHIDLRRRFFKDILERLGGELRLIITGGAAIDPHVFQDLRSIGIMGVQGYGLTEFAPILALNHDKNYKDDSAGTRLKYTEIKIDHPDEDGVGEVLGRGPNLMLGYYEDEALTEASMVDGFFRTADFGYIDEDGFLHLTGRKQNLIVTKGGKNIYPEELETFFSKIAWINECIVYLKPAKRGEDLLSLSIFPNAEIVKDKFGADCALDDPRVLEAVNEEIKELNKELPSYKRIREVTLRKEEFPKSATQKILRNEVTR